MVGVSQRERNSTGIRGEETHLAIEKVTPGIRRYLSTLNTEIAELCHVFDELQ